MASRVCVRTITARRRFRTNVPRRPQPFIDPPQKHTCSDPGSLSICDRAASDTLPDSSGIVRKGLSRQQRRFRSLVPLLPRPAPECHTPPDRRCRNTLGKSAHSDVRVHTFAQREVLAPNRDCCRKAAGGWPMVEQTNRNRKDSPERNAARLPRSEPTPLEGPVSQGCAARTSATPPPRTAGQTDKVEVRAARHNSNAQTRPTADRVREMRKASTDQKRPRSFG